MPVYSFSQIKTFEQCPLKYRYQYIDKIKVAKEPQSPHLLLGAGVHAALEKLYKQLNQFQSVSEDQLIARFHDFWQTEIDYDEITFSEEAPESVFLKRGEAYLHEYYAKHAPFDEVTVVMTEGRIVFSVDEKHKIKFRGVVDRLDKDGSTFIIHDYKTNKHLPDTDKTTYQEQLTLYALGVQEKYGKYYDRLEATLHYLHFGLEDHRVVDEQMMQDVKDKYSTIVREIEQRRFHANMGDANQFPPIENTGCQWCPYQSICPLWAHASMDDEVVIGEKTAKSLVDEYGALNAQARDIKKQKEAIKEALATYAQHKKLERLFGDERQLSARPATYYSVKDSMALEHYLAEQGVIDEYKQLDRHALARGIKEHELDLEAIEDMLKITEKVSLRASKKKK